MDPVFLLTVLFIIGLVVEAMTGAITAGDDLDCCTDYGYDCSIFSKTQLVVPVS